MRAFRRACLDGRVTPVRSLLMHYAVGEARTVSNPAGSASGTSGVGDGPP